MLGKVITARVMPAGLSPAVRVVDKTTSIHEAILMGIARRAARRVHKPVERGKRLLNAWNRGDRGISRTMLEDGTFRYNVIGKLKDKLVNVK